MRARGRRRGDELTIAYNKPCELEDFHDPGLVALMRDLFAHDLRRFGPGFPAGREYRKYWEVAMAARSLRDFGALGGHAEVLGVGAGTENTIFWLTRHARRVHATDLYLAGGEWGDTASPLMLTAPERLYADPWFPRRLIVQHMDGRELRYEDASFDGVFSCSSIEHFGDLEDVHRALAEMCRVLRPGGVAVVSTELRLEGPPPGLPGVLMFDGPQLEQLLAGLDWEPVDGLDTGVSAETLATAVPFADAAADVHAHTEQYGRLRFDTLEWTRYPHLALTQDDLVWTSVNLTLRKRRSAVRRLARHRRQQRPSASI